MYYRQVFRRNRAGRGYEVKGTGSGGREAGSGLSDGVEGAGAWVEGWEAG